MSRTSNHLRFGPYRMPRFKIGQRVGCLARGQVRIVGISDAPQQWPVGAIKGGKSPVLYGSLVRAVKQEQAKDVAKAWGVGASTVDKWRRTLGVEIDSRLFAFVLAASSIAARFVADLECWSLLGCLAASLAVVVLGMCRDIGLCRRECSFLLANVDEALRDDILQKSLVTKTTP